MVSQTTLEQLYILSQKRLQLDRESREIKKLEDALSKQVREILDPDSTVTTKEGWEERVIKLVDGRYTVEISGRRLPAWKEIYAALVGASRAQEIIEKTPISFSISAALSTCTSMKKVEDKFEETVEKVRKKLA